MCKHCDNYNNYDVSNEEMSFHRSILYGFFLGLCFLVPMYFMGYL